MGVKVDPARDQITVDGAPVPTFAPPRPVYLMLNKPVGYVCTAADPHAEKTVVELVSQVDTRVYPVGRLDAESSGLLLMTNDGLFAQRLTHPRYHVPKIYNVRVRGFLDRAAAIQLSRGIELEDGLTAPAILRFVDYDAGTQSTTVEMTLYEGRNRQVRRMMDAVGHPVRDLQRVGFGNLRLKGLSPGTWRKLRPDEVTALLALAVPTPTPPREARRASVPATRPPAGRNPEAGPASGA